MKTRHLAVIEERLTAIAARSLKSGGHSSLDEGLCVMEAVAYVAGEPWSDHPWCACPVIATFLRVWNDALPTDADRDRLLKPLIPRIVGSRSTRATLERSALDLIDQMLTVTPTSLATE